MTSPQFVYCVGLLAATPRMWPASCDALRSITDACIGFAQTVPVSQALAAALRARRRLAAR